MIPYLIKTIVCSGVFLAVYHLAFEKEKMHYFNRFYLLLGIIASFAAPLITITMPAAAPAAGQTGRLATNIVQQFTAPASTTAGNMQMPVLLLIAAIIYVAVTVALIIRFVINITLLTKKISANNIVAYRGAKLVLVDKAVTPYSFLQYIFVNRADYYSNTLEEEVFTHEFTHVTQKHTLDILLIELLQAVAWFNPFIILYRKAIQVNHEFLADEAVLNKYNNVTDYQTLFLAKITQNTHNMFASSFNYLTTKKRLKMMTTTTPRVKMIALQLLSVLLIGGGVLLCSTKTFAQVKQKEQPGKQQQPVTAQAATGDPVPNSATQQMVDEYELSIKNAASEFVSRDGVKRKSFDFRKIDADRLNFIYYSMTDEQRSKATKILGIPEFPPPVKKAPTAEEFKKWAADSKAYGVWIDGKRIANAKLTTLNPGDYCHYFVSGLTPVAIKNDGFRVQVNISTLADYNSNFALSLKYAKHYYALHKNDK